MYFLRGLGRAVCERFLLVEPLKAGWRIPRDVPLEGLRKLQGTIQVQASSTNLSYRRVGRMDLAWFLLMLHCGLRTCKVRHLKLQDIEWDARRLRIEQSKALKDRQIYLDEADLGSSAKVTLGLKKKSSHGKLTVGEKGASHENSTRIVPGRGKNLQL